tara:strand:+ start:322 stop:555 length:234 start_codon:yes stop_codon:yes gene_type:complete
MPAKKIKAAKKKGTMPKSVVNYKKGGSVSSKGVKAPAGFHWMKAGSGFRLMKHTGKFKPHKGASLVAKFKVQKRHKK